ncbi:MAG: glutathione-disulfide reductase [Roseovarius sp.]
MAFDYDLFVIGGGSGGVRAARVAAQTGARVGLAEHDRYGGTCVIRGCVPKKLMVFASEFRAAMRDARAYGWSVRAGGFDWPAFKRRLHAELDRLEGVYRDILARNGVDSFDMRARLADAHTVALADGRQFRAKHILIATGGHPVTPELPGAEHGLSSDDIFHLDQLPDSMLIVGGGYIACEFACILNGLGVKVTQFYRGAQILRGFDDEARGLIADEMIQSGIDLHLGTNVLSMRPEPGGGVRVSATNGSERVFDKVLFATGRAPNSAGMGLEEAGVRLGRKGEVVVDAYSQTSVPSIYAIGDVTDRVNLTPVAIREAMAFVETVFRANPTPMDHQLIPTAIFTQPEFGSVGLTEEEARAREPVEIYCASFRPMRLDFADRPDRALMKLVVSRESRRVLGCHIVAPGAGEMIQLAGIAVRMGATKEDFDRTVAVHPTMAEELVTMAAPVRKG